MDSVQRRELILERYRELVAREFGDIQLTFDASRDSPNSILSTLVSDDYQRFRLCFESRLSRLNRIYPATNISREAILTQVRKLANKVNWQDAYLELVAYDYLNRLHLDDPNLLPSPAVLNHRMPLSQTFAEEFGRREINVDGWFEDYDVFFDVKSLKDNAGEMLEDVYERLRQHLGYRNFMIAAEYAHDISPDQLCPLRDKILEELKSKVSLVGKPLGVTSTVMKGLHFRLNWRGGVFIHERYYDTLRHAENLHRLFLRRHAVKFVKDRPFLLVFVHFPWFNSVVSDVFDHNRKLYRAVARRMFCQYTNLSTPYREVRGDFGGDQTVFEVSRKLAGILFLEDKSLSALDPLKPNVKAYCYLNPNADKSIRRSMFEACIHQMRFAEYDDFVSDNY